MDSLGHQDSWRELFDVVIAKANKPQFYTSEHPFRCYDVEKDTLAFTKVDTFLPNKIYYQGCLKTFLQITKWNGPEVIYFGDHLFSDLRGPSKSGWRTAAIIHELENEIRIQNEDCYRFEQAKFHIIQELLGKLHSAVAKGEECKEYTTLLVELNSERQKARRTMKDMFNRSFGATFLTGTGQESALAYHIHQYADVYTSKPENFLFYCPEAWLHVPYDIKIMSHHVKISFELGGSSMNQRAVFRYKHIYILATAKMHINCMIAFILLYSLLWIMSTFFTILPAIALECECTDCNCSSLTSLIIPIARIDEEY